MDPIRLERIAHGRSGDKGNHANVAVIAYTQAGYDWLRQHLTAEVVRRYFDALGPSRVVRYEAANLLALNFVLYDVLAGGASRSLRSDTQGKTLALALLQMEVPAPAELAAVGDGRCCSRLVRLLGDFIKPKNLGRLVSNGSGVYLAFWNHERLPSPPQEGYPAVAPDLVVEVLSPHDVFPRVMNKVNQYLKAGVRLVWIVVPEDRCVSVHQPGQQPELFQESDTLTGTPVLPGFTCAVRELFP